MKTILFLDDNNIIFENVSPFLKEIGYNVVYFNNSPSAFNYISDNDVNLFLTDIYMNTEYGFDVLETLKEKGFNFKTGIISACDYIDNELRKRNLTCDIIIEKPFEVHNFILEINNLLKAGD